MRVERTGPASFLAQFESDDELLEEHRVNLSAGALLLPTTEGAAVDAKLAVTLRGPNGGEAQLAATVVAAFPVGLALAVDADADKVLAQLQSSPETAEPEQRQNAWDRVRGLSQMEKILQAVKADRTERALLLQDNDPRVLLSVLRNPRLTVEEVARLAKSPFLNFQIADVILKTAQWMSSLDVRLGLVHNPRTPQAFALKILPTLPEADVKAIARAGTSMALKQAALRRLQSR